MSGKFSIDKMTLVSEPAAIGSGKSVVNKITWTNNADGTVRQLWETKTGEDDWVTAFDGLYKKVQID